MMLDFEFYKENYTGKSISVAIIDTGIEEKALNNSPNIRHCIIEDGINKNNHGTLCASKILEIAPDINIIDFNVTDEHGNIPEANVLKAIKQAIDLNVDIIHLSLGFANYSKKMHDLCNYAFQKDILVIAAASYANKSIFPADFDCVIKIQSSKSQSYKISAINESTFSIASDMARLDFSSISGNTSIAAAYFTGICSLLLEAKPLLNRRNVILWLYNNTKNLSNSISSINCIKDTTEHENAIIALLHDDISRYIPFRELMSKSISGYYDYHTNRVVDFSGSNLKDFGSVYFINPNPISSNGNIDFLRDKKKKYIGNFNKETTGIRLKRHKRSNNQRLHSIQSPVVLIVGYGIDCSKFYAQLGLSKQLHKNGFLFRNITYNPLGYIFDMDVYKYPTKLVYPDIVFSINQDIKNMEQTDDFELLIVNVGGGIRDINSDNSNNYGALVNAYLRAAGVDVAVLCVNTIVSPEFIKQDMEKMKYQGVKDVIIAISDKTYNLSTLKSPFGISTYTVDIEKRNTYYQHIRKAFPDCRIVILDEKETQEETLFKNIYQLIGADNYSDII